ncbi:MAG: DEAD/DEAH box helicase [Clostridiaceae bacterium]|nr:DEAD/DEAH box helicase [Clostridiaceae bacterium]
MKCDQSGTQGNQMATEKTFASMNLQPETRSAVIRMGFTTPTSVQIQTIPPMLDWHDIIAKAPTGTGKTCAFGIPIIEHIEPGDQGIQALILSPTRELTLQITQDLRDLAIFRSDIRISAIYGGQRIDRQLNELKAKPQIIVATPGRLADHMRRRSIRLDNVHTVVLDEADRMLDMGFVRDVRRILDQMPKVAQIAMFSATMSRSVMDISWIYQRDAVEITVLEDEFNKPDITQYSINVHGNARIRVIRRLIEENDYKKVLVFCNTKQMVQSVHKQMKAAGLKADRIHGDIRQHVREKVLNNFRKGKLPILVATDVASRGLDIDGVDAVFNYDIPLENEHYTHRIGRTGRAQKSGVAYTFTNVVTQPRLDEIVRYTRTQLIPLELD